MAGKKILGIALVGAFLISIGCQSMSGDWTRDPISAGTAKMLLETGKTSQKDVVEAFGGPNIVSGESDGTETWTYDRMAYTSSSSAGGMLLGGAGGGGPGGGGALVWGHASRSSSSSRTMTLFLYWKDGVLVDYKYRSSIY